MSKRHPRQRIGARSLEHTVPADIVVFDPNTIRDKATFAEPTLPSEGVSYVFVNGVLVLEGGKFTGAKPGKVLRGPGWDGKP